jgi:hypothetical protein
LQQGAAGGRRSADHNRHTDRQARGACISGGWRRVFPLCNLPEQPWSEFYCFTVTLLVGCDIKELGSDAQARSVGGETTGATRPGWLTAPCGRPPTGWHWRPPMLAFWWVSGTCISSSGGEREAGGQGQAREAKSPIAIDRKQIARRSWACMQLRQRSTHAQPLRTDRSEHRVSPPLF